MRRIGPVAAATGGARGWVAFGVLLLACFMYSFTLQVVNLATPEIARELHPTAAQLLWVVDVYGFVLAGLVLPMGALSDRFGHRRMLLIGTALFAVASVCAAASPTPEALIASRVFLGVAGATIAPSTMALVFSIFERPSDIAVAIALWTVGFSAGSALGPMIGGVVLAHGSWRAVFLPAVAIAVVVLAVGMGTLPERRAAAVGRFDYPGAILALCAVLGIVYGFKEMVTADPGLDAYLAALLGVVLAVGFVLRQRRAREPMIPRELLRNRYVLGSLAGYLGVALAIYAFQYFMPQFLTLVLGIDTAIAGVVVAAAAAGTIFGSLLTPSMTRRFRAQTVMIVGLMICAITVLGYTQLTTTTSAWFVALGLFANGVGGSMVFVSANNIILSSAPPDARGAASGVTEMSGELGASLGIAIFGGVGGMVYRFALDSELQGAVPSGILSEAGEGIASVEAAAASANATEAQLLTDAAQLAFVQEVHLIGLCAAAVALIALVLVWVAFHKRRHEAVVVSGT